LALVKALIILAFPAAIDAGLIKTEIMELNVVAGLGDPYTVPGPTAMPTGYTMAEIAANHASAICCAPTAAGPGARLAKTEIIGAGLKTKTNPTAVNTDGSGEIACILSPYQLAIAGAHAGVVALSSLSKVDFHIFNGSIIEFFL
jgi:hypothetical protein